IAHNIGISAASGVGNLAGSITSGAIVSGSTTSGLTFLAAGVENILAGGIDNGTGVNSGGHQNIFNHGFASNTLIGATGVTTISGGGTLDLNAGATESGSVIFADPGGKLMIDGTAMPATVISG